MVTQGGNSDHPYRQSIPLLIFKDLAKQFRKQLGIQFDIKAHPINATSATLVFKNPDHKISFYLFAGNLDLLLAIVKLLSVPYVKAWVDKHKLFSQPFNSEASTSKYIISVDIIKGNKLSSAKSPVPIGIDLADPDSISEIKDWISVVVQNV